MDIFYDASLNKYIVCEIKQNTGNGVVYSVENGGYFNSLMEAKNFVSEYIKTLVLEYSPDQSRDEKGRFSSDGGSGGETKDNAVVKLFKQAGYNDKQIDDVRKYKLHPKDKREWEATNKKSMTEKDKQDFLEKENKNAADRAKQLALGTAGNQHMPSYPTQKINPSGKQGRR